MKIRTNLQLGALIPIVLSIAVCLGLSVALCSWVRPPGAENSATALVAVLFAIFALAVAGAFYAMGRTVSSRIARLQNAVDQARSGTFEAIQDMHEDELSDISSGLNDLVTDLKKYAVAQRNLEELETQFSEVNHELEKAKETAERLREADIDVSDGLERLHRAQELLIQHQRMNLLGQMFAGISHDMNSALTSILTRAEVRLRYSKQLSEEARLDYTAVQSAAETIRKQFQELSHMYRLPATVMESVDIEGVVDEAISLAKPTWKAELKASGSEITIRKECQDGLAVYGNRLDLTQMLLSLISNSTEAMPEGGTITIKSETTATGDVAISVSDAGHGMDDQVKERCCRPFFTTKEQAAGIGLALTAGIVEQHQGKLSIVTDKDSGTTVLVELPPTKSKQALSKIQPLGQPLAPGLKILLVEDDPWTAEILARGLRAEDRHVEVATNGADGLEKFKAGSFDVVITDRAMPKMTGDELAADLKKMTPELPVLLMTGFADVIKAKGERPKNVDAVIGKPVVMAELTHILADVMSTGGRPVEAPA